MNNNQNSAGETEDAQFFDPGILTPSNQWQIIYKQKLQQFLTESNKLTNTSEANENDISPCWSLYQQRAIHIARFSVSNLTLNLQDIADSNIGGPELTSFIQQNCLLLAQSLDETVDEFVKETLAKYLEFYRYSTSHDTQSDEDYQLIHDEASNVQRKFYCSLACEEKAMSIRELRCEMIGRLVTVRGTATRLSEIRPELKSASFKCLLCQELIPNVQQEFKFTEPTRCVRRECKNRNAWGLVLETCRFADWQKLRLQENSAEIPAGSMPRAFDVILTRRLGDCCKAGDKIVVTGCLAAIPDVSSLMRPGELPRSLAMERNRANRSEYGTADNTVSGLKRMGARDLSHRVVFIAHGVKVANAVIDVEYDGLTNAAATAAHVGRSSSSSSSVDLDNTDFRHMDDLTRTMEVLGVSQENVNLFLGIAESRDTLSQLSKSMAPEIFGCNNVKKGIILMIVGGVEKITGKDNLKLRGDINVCIVGDPGTAKSQLLKYVKQFAPRSVYTSGITSSAAGLTVSITKDADQSDSVIEAGALMLADRGICCIDEFDKMNLKDMIAIHEAMEQQTISVCKGGVQATLNARASVLAACNPRKGRYDLTRPFRHNVRLSAPIISRFDLFFVLLDSTEHDEGVGLHLINLHGGSGSSSISGGLAAASHGVLSRELLGKYLMVAKCRKPKLTERAGELLVKSYVGLRADCLKPGGNRSAAVTVRSLESLVRLSEAVAKLKFASEVETEHVEEAIALMQSSLMRLERSSVTLGEDSAGVGGGEGDGQSREDKEGRQINIEAEEFERIASAIINKLREDELEEAAASNEDRQGLESWLTKDNLIAWYMENYMMNEGDVDDAVVSKEYEKLSRVIDRMVANDMSLIEETRWIEEFVEGKTETTEIVVLRRHPNYCGDGMNSSYMGDASHKYAGAVPRHATLSSAFFEESSTDESLLSGLTDQEPAGRRGGETDTAPGSSTDVAVESSTYLLTDDEFLAEMYGWKS